MEDDADSSETLLLEPQVTKVGPEQIPYEAPVNNSELSPRMLTCIPREELYDLVWSAPMIHVARRLGRSDRALAKACRKLDVPVPGIGYWNKLAAGKPVASRPALPTFSINQ